MKTTKLHSKLNSNRGATLLFALVAMLVATLVSALIIYAAEDNARRIDADRQAEQNRLTLNSAAALLRDEIVEDAYTYESTTVTIIESRRAAQEGSPTATTTTPGIPVEKQTYSNGTQVKYDTDNPASDSRTAIEKTLCDWCYRVLNKTDEDTPASLNPAKEYTLQVTLNDGSQDRRLEDVTVRLSMEPGGLMGQSPEEKEISDTRKYYIFAELFLTAFPQGEHIRMTFMSNDPPETPRTQSASTTHTEEVEGQSCFVTTTTQTTEKNVTITWEARRVVVNAGS